MLKYHMGPTQSTIDTMGLSPINKIKKKKKKKVKMKFSKPKTRKKNPTLGFMKSKKKSMDLKDEKC